MSNYNNIKRDEYYHGSCLGTIIGMVLFWIILIVIVLSLFSCTPCRPCKRGYYLDGDSCRYIVMKPSRLYW